MSETSPLSRPVRFCPGCGEPAASGASFCSGCGARLAAEKPPPPATQPSSVPPAALVVLVGFLAVGLALWVLLLAPGKEPTRMPLAQKKPEPNAPPPAAGAALPQSHPPIEIPADVKRYIAELEQKAAAQPKDAAAWKAVAQVEYRAGQVDRAYLGKAEESFGHVLELDPKDLDALRGLGNVYFDREEYGKAVESYQRYLVLKPDEANVRTDLGTMYLYGGDPQKAIAEYAKVLAKDPKFYQAHYNLGIAYAQKGDTAKALAELGEARALAPDDRTRKQIESMIDQAKGEGGRSASSGSVKPKGFQDLVEDSLRSHPIVGPKIVRLEWSSATEGQVRLREFPMQGMPDTVRQKFLDRLKGQLADARRESGSAGAAKLELVDDASDQVMATVTAE
jgi:tetratricopeptide (TPR) repeat protein